MDVPGRKRNAVHVSIGTSWLTGTSDKSTVVMDRATTNFLGVNMLRVSLGLLIVLGFGAVSSAANVVKISLKCNNQQESVTSGDQIYVIVKADGKEVPGFGRDNVLAIKNGETGKFDNLSITFTKTLTVQVKEKDPSSDDNLGTAQFTNVGQTENLKGIINAGKFDYDVTID